MQKARLHVCFSGAVQGVGFRFTTKRIAEQYEVTGFVKNLPNRQVEVVAEGDREVVESFINDIYSSSLSDYIRNMEKESSPATGEYSGFNIEF